MEDRERVQGLIFCVCYLAFKSQLEEVMQCKEHAGYLCSLAIDCY